MDDKFTVDVGAQYVRGAVRLAVLSARTAAHGTVAVLAVGSFPSAQRVRLRAGESWPLPTGGSLRFAAFNPAGRRGTVALELIP